MSQHRQCLVHHASTNRRPSVTPTALVAERAETAIRRSTRQPSVRMPSIHAHARQARKGVLIVPAQLVVAQRLRA